MSTKNFIIAIIGFSFAFASPRADAQDFGSLGVPMLRISPNARQVGMGEAFTAIGEHNLLRYNVGGLGVISYPAFSLNYQNWIDDTNQGSIEVSLPISFGVLGFGFDYFDQGSVEARDENFQPTANGSINSNDLMLTLAYSYAFNFGNNQLSLGLGSKFIRQDLVGISSSSIGLDIGALFVIQAVSFGLTLQNLTLNKATFDSQDDILPQMLRGGVALRMPAGEDLNLKIASDVAKLWRDGDIRIYSGAELQISNLISMRTGYKFNGTEASRWGLGLGLTMPTEWLGRSRTEIDYAYSPLGDFDTSVHRISLTFNFGVLEPVEPVDPLAAQRIGQMEERLSDELRAAEEARRRAEEAARLAELRAQELEELRRRLEKIQEIAEASEGKIEVTPAADTSRIYVSLRINFDFDKSEIRPSEFETMDQIAEILNTFPESKLWIAGHADSIGTEVYNIHLSNRRMLSVMTHLITKGNTDSERFFMPIAYGESRPVADNGTEAGRARNRRVDFTIFTRDSIPDIPEGSGVTSVRALNDTSFAIVNNGRIVNFKESELNGPPRVIFDLPGIYNLSSSETYNFTNKTVLRARIAYHPVEKFTRVVFDLPRRVPYETEVVDNFIVIRILSQR